MVTFAVVLLFAPLIFFAADVIFTMLPYLVLWLIVCHAVGYDPIVLPALTFIANAIGAK